ncbi:MBL fold metallo-hydrolase [Chlamydiales bacterium]|nr:MBL fold metallo-hydrolase [Chlamydiales bacterium]
MQFADCKVTVIEGNHQRLDGGAMFGNAPKSLWEKWIQADDQNRIPLACRSLFIERRKEKFLFDAGIGAFFSPKLRERYGVIEEEHLLLKDLPVSHEEVDHVILSHLHFDHAGGLLSKYGEGEAYLLFPNATYWISEEAFKRGDKPQIRDKASFIPGLTSLLKESGRLKFIDQKTSFGDPFSVTFSEGHTPGLVILWIGDELACMTDLIPGLPWIHLPITMGYDRFPERKVIEKEQFLKDVHNKNTTLFLTHDPVHSFCKVRQDEKGRYYGEAIS